MKYTAEMRQVFFTPRPEPGDWRIPVHCKAKKITLAGISFDLHPHFVARQKYAFENWWAISRNGIFFHTEDPDTYDTPERYIKSALMRANKAGVSRKAYIDAVMAHQRQYTDVTMKGAAYFARERDYWEENFIMGGGRER